MDKIKVLLALCFMLFFFFTGDIKYMNVMGFIMLLYCYFDLLEEIKKGRK